LKDKGEDANLYVHHTIFSFFLPREIIFYKKKNKKSVSGDNRIQIKLGKYLKLDLFHVNNHPHTQRLFVTGKNDRIFEKVNHIYLMMFHCQKNCPMQKANGLQLKLSGASYSSLMSGMVLGYSCHPHSITNYEKALATTNKEVRKKMKI